MKLSNRDLELINKVSNKKEYKIEEIFILSNEEIIELTELLGELIGYDEDTDDIDLLGREADSVISKLLILLEERGKK